MSEVATTQELVSKKLSIGEQLDAKIPRSVVSERDGGGGRRLSYLEGHYVIDRLNKVFGHMHWHKEITDVKEVINTTSKGEFPAYLIKVRLTIEAEGRRVVKEGYGYGCDKSGLNAHELAIKEAVTDALKVAAKDLGMSMGLALYDKSQENVDDEEEAPVEAKETAKPALVTDEATDHSKLTEAIKSYARIAVAQKKLVREEFGTYIKKTYKADSMGALSTTQLQEVLKYLQDLTK